MQSKLDETIIEFKASKVELDELRDLFGPLYDGLLMTPPSLMLCSAWPVKCRLNTWFFATAKVSWKHERAELDKEITELKNECKLSQTMALEVTTGCLLPVCWHSIVKL